MYALKAYYSFICLVESVYLTNLNIKMIRAYADSVIMDVILGGILKDKHLENKFRSLCADDVGTKEQQQIMKYLMERYANMRGTFLLSASQTTLLKDPLIRGRPRAAEFLMLL